MTSYTLFRQPVLYWLETSVALRLLLRSSEYLFSDQIDCDKVAERVVSFYFIYFFYSFVRSFCSDVDRIKSSSSVDIRCDVCRSIKWANQVLQINRSKKRDFTPRWIFLCIYTHSRFFQLIRFTKPPKISIRQYDQNLKLLVKCVQAISCLWMSLSFLLLLLFCSSVFGLLN